MKYLAVLVITAAFLGLGYFFAQPSVVQNNTMDSKHHDHSHAHPDINQQVQQAASKKNNQTVPVQSSTLPSGKTGNPHFDQLSPEMQQALKDSLLLENSTETMEGESGTIILPAKGRFTQMPVAVQMPDGTIEIREYSNIPKTAPEYKLKK